MKKGLSILLLIFLSMQNIFAYELSEKQIDRLNFSSNKCENYKQSDIPTIFIPGILASWYSEEGFKDTKIKRWIPDPITHVYDTLFKVFSEEGKYDIKDVFYINEFETYIDGNPKQSLYLFGYDWKKDNKITAKLLRDLILQIRLQYEEVNGCDIGSVNIIGHSMGGLVARSMLENMCANDYDLNNYYRNIKKGKIKKINSNNCYNYTKINKFITISTPQRGSPNSFPMWEKGDLLMTNAFMEGEALKTQLGIGTNKGLYEIIHGYNEKVPNGIVTIGQLLPDLKNQNKYNEDLKYLFINDKKAETKNYPQNSFLEELNRKENIEQMFKNISGKYSMYYSELTGNKNDFFFFTKNNITGYDLKTKYFDITKGLLNYDNTKRVYGKDIYNKYKKNIKTNMNGPHKSRV